MKPHKFDPAAFTAKQQAKRDLDAQRKAKPTPTNVPTLTERVKLLEETLGV